MRLPVRVSAVIRFGSVASYPRCVPKPAELVRVAAIAAGLFWLGPRAILAQTTDAASVTRTLLRPAEVLGLPGITIDLSKKATQRYAMVIGNGAYEHVPTLPNAVSDAHLVASVLKRSGYVVEEYDNLTKRGFETALRRLMFETSNGTEVVIYYAGHGVQIGRSNRLIPVDAKITSIYDLPFETVSLSSVLAIAGARSRSLVVILDSCRDNPFPRKDVIAGLDAIPQELTTGFAAQDSPVNSLLVYSTAPGAVALDGKDGHSPFTEAFVKDVEATPDKPLVEVLQRVRSQVYAETNGFQVPWETSSLVETLALNPVPGAAPVASETKIANAGVAGNGSTQSDGAASVGSSAISLSLPLERSVNVGEAIRSARPGDTGQVFVTKPPEHGTLKVVSGDAVRGLVPLAPIAGGIGDLIYANGTPDISAVDMKSPTITDSFDISVNNKPQKVHLTLKVDPCDFQAGDHLDPDGVGVARYPNEIDIPKALKACKEAVQKSPRVGRFHYELGRVYLALRNLDAAQKEFTIARDLGHTRAWQALGMLEIQRQQEAGGLKHGKISDKALALLQMGVQRGDPYAFHSLGLQLLHSDNPTLQRQGFDLLQRAMEVGHTFSMNSLGAYFLQKGTDHYEPQRGLRYYEESAKRGDIYGYDNMGIVTLNGLAGVKRDPQKAFEWFKKASDQGHPTAPTSIGRMYNAGDLGKPDYVAAVKWYKVGLSRGDAWGGANAAWVIVHRKPKGFTDAEAAALAAKAAVLRDAKAAKAADDVLSGLPPRAINAGAQILMQSLGESVGADGNFGPQSEAALARIFKRFSRTPPTEPGKRLKALAQLYWTTNKFRVDLY